jgi:hypothetical protein
MTESEPERELINANECIESLQSQLEQEKTGRKIIVDGYKQQLTTRDALIEAQEKEIIRLKSLLTEIGNEQD